MKLMWCRCNAMVNDIFKIMCSTKLSLFKTRSPTVMKMTYRVHHWLRHMMSVVVIVCDSQRHEIFSLN